MDFRRPRTKGILLGEKIMDHIENAEFSDSDAKRLIHAIESGVYIDAMGDMELIKPLLRHPDVAKALERKGNS